MGRTVRKEEEVNKKLITLILSGTFLAATAIPMSSLAGRGGRMSGQTQQIRNQSQQQIRDQQRPRDGSYTDPAQKGSGAKRGNTYGPGDGTGNAGIGPKDGTGYGAPSSR